MTSHGLSNATEMSARSPPVEALTTTSDMKPSVPLSVADAVAGGQAVEKEWRRVRKKLKIKGTPRRWRVEEREQVEAKRRSPARMMDDVFEAMADSGGAWIELEELQLYLECTPDERGMMECAAEQWSCLGIMLREGTRVLFLEERVRLKAAAPPPG